MLKQDLNSQRELNVAAGQTSPEVTQVLTLSLLPPACWLLIEGTAPRLQSSASLQLTRQTLATGLNEQSLRASVADPDVDSMKLASQLDSLRKEADSAAGRHHDETTALRKETTNLKTDLETTQRELARARQEQDLHQEELGKPNRVPDPPCVGQGRAAADVPIFWWCRAVPDGGGQLKRRAEQAANWLPPEQFAARRCRQRGRGAACGGGAANAFLST